MHAKTALEIGKPSTLLIVNPLQYTAHPRALMAVCAAQLGQLDQAITLGEEVLQFAPSYALVAQNIDGWRWVRQSEQTVAQWIQGAQLLTAAGELYKAWRLLDSVPHFATDDERIIQAREQVKRDIDAAVTAPAIEATEDAAGNFLLRELEAVAA